jgi:hypothetical protein
MLSQKEDKPTFDCQTCLKLSKKIENYLFWWGATSTYYTKTKIDIWFTLKQHIVQVSQKRENPYLITKFYIQLLKKKNHLKKLYPYRPSVNGIVRESQEDEPIFDTKFSHILNCLKKKNHQNQIIDNRLVRNNILFASRKKRTNPYLILNFPIS